jgi:hypothetical protein
LERIFSLTEPLKKVSLRALFVKDFVAQAFCGATRPRTTFQISRFQPRSLLFPFFPFVFLLRNKLISFKENNAMKKSCFPAIRFEAALLRRLGLVLLLGFLTACSSSDPQTLGGGNPGDNTGDGGGGPTSCNDDPNNVAPTSFGFQSVGLHLLATKVSTQNAGQNPSIATALDGQGQLQVYIAWTDIFNNRIRFASSADGGQTFDVRQNTLGEVSPSPNSGPFLAARGEYVYVVWAEPQISGGSVIQLVSSSNSGANFLTEGPLSSPGNTSVTPSITASNDNVYVTWVDLGTTQGDQPDQLLRSKTHGGTFSSLSAQNVSVTGSVALTPAALVAETTTEGDHLYIAWEDSGAGDANAGQILFRRSEDGGQTFIPSLDSTDINGDPVPGPPATLSDSNSHNPSLAISPDHVFVIWEGINAIDNSPILRLVRSDRSADDEPFGSPLDFATIVTQGPPHIAAGGDNVFITWGGRTDQFCNRQVLALTSTSAGDTFTGPRDLSQNPEGSGNPVVSAANGKGYFAWQGQSQANESIFFDAIDP